ncbi:MAG: proline--tRNA ligase [Candidatus Pacearchaeota archaeon]
MTYTEIKEKGEKKYYYRGKSIRKGDKVTKERVYLGVNLTKKELQEKEQQADKQLLNIQEKEIKPEIKQEPKKEKSEQSSKDTLGITADKDEFSEWFTQIMLKADLADYTDVSGCIVFKPTAYAIWEKIKQETDIRFKKLGIQNTYFPLFIPEKFLSKEKEHVEGFSPEVAWVTQAGDTKLNERLAVRPTSETIMYPSYSKWIRSYKDLPLKYNQWNNVVRWEFKHPVPFLRTREFLWNELHTVLSTEKEALEEGKNIIKAYKEICENYLALYGEYGRKTQKEKFAGAVFSEKLHYIMPNGKAIEGPCFHYDGQNFAKAYDIKFLDENSKEQYAYQNTYAISTRMLGVMFAIHSDDKGLIIPPKIAPNQIVIIPIFFEKDKKQVIEKAKEIQSELLEFNPILDDREDYRPGFKFNEYELKGIPIRIELGSRDLEKKEVIVVRRDNYKKQPIKISDLNTEIPKILGDIQNDLFEKSKKQFKQKIKQANNLSEIKEIIKNKEIGIVPLCKNENCEDILKSETEGAKTLFIADKKISLEKCIICNKPADYYVYVGKTY